VSGEINTVESFRQYRGDGTTKDGERVETRNEKGVYLASPELAVSVNTALAVGQPLLVTGDAGTGKTALAYSIAAELELGDVEVFVVRSDHQGRDLLYEFDNLQRFYDAHVDGGDPSNLEAYLRLGPLGRVIAEGQTRVVLIDEIDKAPRDLPNDLLHVLDRMEVRIPELKRVLKSDQRPIVIITSNRESQLPDPFLRRCVFHHIEFPHETALRLIVAERLKDLQPEESLVTIALKRFHELRDIDNLQKKPATMELLTWIRVLVKAGVPAERLATAATELPFLGAVLKTHDDLLLVTQSQK
jgi:MoxR-like ATPase